LVARHGPLSTGRACHYIRQAALGLQHAHEAGLVHRDIKPGNLILDRAGTVKVLDLGLARFAQDPAKNQGITDRYDKNIVIGTVDFMSPEQAFDSAAVDIRSDIYGLGCTFYFLLTGQVPFPERSVPEKMYSHKTRAPAPLSEICPRLPACVIEVLDKMMAKEQADRYQTPAEVAEALAEWTAEPIPPPAANEMPERPASFYRLGLPPGPGPGSALAVPPTPLSSAETVPTPRIGEWDVPGGDTPDPSVARPGPRIPTTTPAQEGGPSIVLSTPPAPPRKRSSWVLRVVELAVLVTVAGLVGWLASRKWGGGDVPQPGPVDPLAPAVVPAPDDTPPGALLRTILNGGGSTFVDPIMRRWATAYEKQHGVKVDYQPIGSGKGVQGVLDRVYLFGCSDVALNDEQLAEVRARGGDVVHIPLVMGAVVAT